MRWLDGKREHRNWNARTVLVPAAVIAGAVVMIVSAVAALKGRDALKIDQAVYTCVNGMKLSLGEKVKLTRKDGTTYLKSGRKKENLQSFPLITEEDGSIILQKSCSWTTTSNDEFYRVDYFTAVTKEDDGIVMRRRGKEVRETSGFLYDNDDTYLFLEEALLQLGDRQIYIAPMTVVQVDYLSHIQMFGPGVEPFFEYLDQNNVVAEFGNGKKVDLAIDRYYMENGSWRLLFMPLDILKEMTTGETGDEEK